MKILQIIPYYYLNWSNEKPVEIISEISTAINQKGHDITIYTTDIFNKNKAIKRKDICAVKVHEFSSIGKYPFFISFEMLTSIVSTLKQYDIVHIHEYRTFISIVVYLTSKKNKIPYIIQAHGALPDNIGRGEFKRIFDLLIGKKILQNASSVIAITHKEAEDYEKLGVPRTKIKILPNGVDLSIINKLPQTGLFKRKYLLPQDSNLVLYLGRLDDSKGIDLLLYAYADIQKKVDNTFLIIIGKDYGVEQSLKSLTKRLDLETKVIFTGFLKPEDKLSAFVDSTVFVTPSFSGFPHTFLEACACGVSIVTTNRFDNLNWINDNVGYIVNYNRCELTERIIQLLQDNKLREKFGKNGRNLVNNQFNWDIISKQLIDIYYTSLNK